MAAAGVVIAAERGGVKASDVVACMADVAACLEDDIMTRADAAIASAWLVGWRRPWQRRGQLVRQQLVEL